MMTTAVDRPTALPWDVRSPEPGPATSWWPRSVGLATCALFLVLAAGCHRGPASPPANPSGARPRTDLAPVVVQLTNATERLLPRYLRVTGQLAGRQDALVAADTAGKVIEVLVERGSVVAAGGVLARVDDRTAQLQGREAGAAVALAEANLALARNEVERHAPLVKDQVIADADFRRLQASQAAREADLAGAMARQELAQKTLADAVIRAPFAGVVAERFVEAGEYVKTDSRIARVVAVSRLRLLLNVPETSAGRVREGQSVAFTTAAFPGETFTGELRFIGAAVRESARDLLVEAEVANPDGRLQPGLFAEARVRLGEAAAVVVPGGALRSDGGRRSVFQVEDGALAERLVEVGDAVDGWVEIRRGLAAGAAVVILPEGGGLADGQPATVTQP